MVASVVVLPLPVGPVITIMPCGSASSRVMIASSRLDRPSLPISSRPRSRGNRRITALSPCCVGMVATRTSSSERLTRTPRRAVLRQAPLGDVEAGENLDARDQRLRRNAGRRRHRAQQAVDAHAHHEPGAERLDVDVAGAQLDRALQQVVERAHHRRAAGEIAQALDVVVGLLARRPRPRRRAVRSMRWSSTVVMSSNEATATSTGVAEHDFGGANGRGIGGIGDRECRSLRSAGTGRSWIRAGNAGKSRRLASVANSCGRLSRTSPKYPRPHRRIRQPTGRSLPTIPARP